MKRKVRKIVKVVGFACAWTVVGAIFATPYVLRGGGTSALFAVMLNWQLWGAAAPLIQKFDTWLPNPRQKPLVWTGAHVGFGIVLSSTYVVVASALAYWLGFNKWNPWSQPVALLDWFLWALLVYAVIAGACQALKYFRHHVQDELRIERLERSFAEARLRTLRSQLDPHFLFNALNGIGADIERNPKMAREMIEHLAELLRMSLKAQQFQLVSMSEELSFLEAYIALQKMRFGDRIKIECTVTPEAQRTRMPSLLFQPLVENAIRHGVSGRIAGGQVWVSANVADNELIIQVADDGVGLPSGWNLERDAGLGLSATRERLIGLYPGRDDRLKVYPRTGGGVIVEARLPLGEGKKAIDAAA